MDLPVVGVGAVLFNDEGRILLVKRSHDPGEGRWSIPGGILELGEEVFEGARRELEEETGLKATPRGIVGVAEYIERSRSGAYRFHYVILDVLFGKPVEGRLHAASDAADVGFYSVEYALSNLQLTSTTRLFLEEIRRWGAKPVLIRPVTSRVNGG